MVNIFKNTILIASYTALHNAFKAAFMPVSAHLSRCCQQRVSVDVVGKIAKPYLCPGSYNANASHDQIAGHHRHHPKHMLNPGAYLCPRPVSLLLPLGQLAVFTALALQLFTKSQFFKPLYRLLRPIGGISIHITAPVVFLQQLFKHLAVMYRGIRHRVAANQTCALRPRLHDSYSRSRFFRSFWSSGHQHLFAASLPPASLRESCLP